MSITILIPSGAGSPGFGGIAECLREIPDVKIISGDINTQAYGKFLSDAFIHMPAGDSKEYPNALLKAVEAYGCDVVLPITTRELYPLSGIREEIEKLGGAIAITFPESLLRVNNKHLLYSDLEKTDLPVVKFKAAKNFEEFKAAVFELGYPDSQVIMKPSEGNGSRGFRILVSQKELRELYFESKSGALYTCLDSAAIEMPGNFPDELLVCEFLPGTEWSVDLIAEHGTVLISSTRIREKTVSGISTRGTFVHIPEIDQQVAALCKMYKLHGPIGIQFKARKNGEAVLLEINPRLQGAVSTARFIGVNYPKLSVQMALGLLPEIPENQDISGISFARYWKDVTGR